MTDNIPESNETQEKCWVSPEDVELTARILEFHLEELSVALFWLSKSETIRAEDADGIRQKTPFCWDWKLESAGQCYRQTF